MGESIVYAGLLAYIFVKWTDISSFGSGASGGAVIAFLISLSVDLMMYSYTTMITEPFIIFIDVVAATAIGAITGGVIGLVLGMGAREN